MRKMTFSEARGGTAALLRGPVPAAAAVCALGSATLGAVPGNGALSFLCGLVLLATSVGWALAAHRRPTTEIIQ